jgi:hypothetical protein
MAYPQFITLAPSLARTANGNGDALDLAKLFGVAPTLGLPPSLLVQSDVTAVGGTTPSLTVLIEDSIDGGVTWNTVGTFAAQTAAGRAVIQVAPSGVAQAAGFRWPFNARRVRARWTVSGTSPSVTFSVKAVLL